MNNTDTTTIEQLVTDEMVEEAVKAYFANLYDPEKPSIRRAITRAFKMAGVADLTRRLEEAERFGKAQAHLLHVSRSCNEDWERDRDAHKARADKAEASLKAAGYTDRGSECWVPPLGPNPSPLLTTIDELRQQLADINYVFSVAGTNIRCDEAGWQYLTRLTTELASLQCLPTTEQVWELSVRENITPKDAVFKLWNQATA